MHELLVQVIFYVFSGLTVVSALMVITQNNPVRCVLFLVLAFLASSVLWILVNAEFLALILVLVYVGAVMTLFLFVVMMLNIDIESMKTHFLRYLPFGLILVALLVGLLMSALSKDRFGTGVEQKAVSELTVQVPHAEETSHPGIQEMSRYARHDESLEKRRPLSDTEALGMVLYTDYIFAFELAAVILLVAIIAAITLVHRNPVRSKRQNVVQQIMTRRADRVTLLDMKSEKP
jgi:NADH-quinone oxidoreductase subunit J